MKELFLLYQKRIIRQKFIWFFLLAVAFAAYAYAFLISSPDMADMLNVEIHLVGKSHFPEFLLRFFSGIVGPLFFAFLIGHYICEEIHLGVFMEPILRCKTRKDLLNVRYVHFGLVTAAVVFSIGLIGYAAAWLRWGNQVFIFQDIVQTAAKYLLTGFSMIALESILIYFALLTRSTAGVVGAAVLYVAADYAFYQFGSKIASFLWFGYYPYHFIFQKEFSPVPGISLLSGIGLSILYSLLFYILASRRIQKMNF